VLVNACRLTIALITLTASRAAPVFAQSTMVGGGVDTSLQWFTGDSSLNRLNGSTAGWTVLGGARLGRFIIRAEGTREGTIRDLQITNVFVNGRSVSVRSELAHDMDAVSAFGGYARNLTARVELTLMGGVSFITVHRTFTTDAGEVILIAPSNIPSTATTTTLIDRFAAWSVGADVFVGATRHVGLIAGVRTEPLKLRLDLSGQSLRVLAGAAWRQR
jgi:hypothetical protein